MKKSVKKIKFFNRMIAIVLMLSLVIPCFDVIGVFDVAKNEVEVLASDVTEGAEGTGTSGENGSGEQTGENPTEQTKKYKYAFSLCEEVSIYNYDTGTYGEEFTEDGTGFEGVYKNDFKTDDNQSLKISELGTYGINAEGKVVSNPYVVLEISPSSEVSQIRPHVGGQSFFDMTKEEYDAIALTDEEKQVVKIQALQYLFEEHAEEVDTFTTSEYNNALKIQKEKTDAAKAALDAVKEEQARLEEENREQEWQWTDNSILKKKRELENIIEPIEQPYRTDAVKKYGIENGFLNQDGTQNWDSQNQQRVYNETGYYYYDIFQNFKKSDIINNEIDKLLDVESDVFNEEFYNQVYENKQKLKELEERYNQNAIRLQEISQELPKLQNTYDTEKAVQDSIKKETKTVAGELNKAETDEIGIASLETFLCATTSIDENYLKAFYSARFDSALAYKKKYELSVSTVQTFDVTQYIFNYDYERFYKADENGKLEIYSTEGDKTEYKPSGNKTTNSYVGEYKTTISPYNPLAQVGATVNGTNGLSGSSFQGPSNAIIVNNYTFQKNCLDLGYDSKLNSTNTRIESQTPRVDEYIFAGWYVEIERNGKMELVSIDEKDSNGNYIVTDAVLSSITNLYTAWTYRFFDEEIYYWLAPSASESETVSLEFTSYDGKSQCYTVHVPASIASANRKLHHPNNQVTVCTGEKNKLVLKEGNDYVAGKEYSYVMETSAWDFDFSKSKYNTVESLKNVALKLMPDTDYYLLTYNAVPGVDKEGNNTITYYPYNIRVITITPQELNKMVYYDYSVIHKGEAGYIPDNYMDSGYLNTFLNNVDFIYLTNGGGSPYYFKKDDKVSYTYRPLSKGEWDGEQVNIIPVVERTPTLYTIDSKSNKLVYDKNRVVASASWSANLTAIPDLEWQVVEKIYSRSSDEEQVRKIAMIINEALADAIAGNVGTAVQIKNANGEYTSGSDYNLSKLILMYFSFKDPTKFFDYYINPEYQSEGHDRFDKVRGVAREDAPKSESYFTGSLYDYERWNTALFFPWELITEFTGHTHKDMLDASKSSEMFNQLYPYNSFLDNLGKQLYASVGLATMSNYKNISNPYAFTFNGDNSLASQFFDYNREYLDNLTNAWDRQCFPEPPVYPNAGNSHLAFEYFESIGRGEENPYGEVRNGYISAKSAIEFMVQNAQLAKDTELKRSITILNKLAPQSKFVYGNTIIRVDRVVMDDISQPDVDVEFMFNGYEEGYYVVEYLWTNRYRNLDNENDEAQFWYSYYTNKAITDTSSRWYKMPDSSGLANKESFFITRLIDAENNYVSNPSSYINHINRGTGYVFNTPIKPNVKLENGNDAPGTNNPTYIIVVKQYAKDDLEMKNLKSVTIKNVCIEKMSYLFNLD